MAADGTAFQLSREELFAELGRSSSKFRLEGHEQQLVDEQSGATGETAMGRFIVNVGIHRDVQFPLRYPELLIGEGYIRPAFYLLEVLGILILLRRTAEARCLAAFLFKGIFFTLDEGEEGKKWVAHYFPALSGFNGDFDWLFIRNQSSNFYERVEVWPTFILIPPRKE
jgi:hypothetical protein